MSDFTIAYVPPRAVEQSLFPVLAFIALLLLVFVELNALARPVPAYGDAVRQFAYLSVGGFIGLAAVLRFGLGALRALPLSMGLLLVWCLASADSFSRITSEAPGWRWSSSIAVARPTMPPPIMQKSWIIAWVSERGHFGLLIRLSD